ncbi:nucleotidyl transferase AbiEii/AbiGii toxin family protein [Salmonella enterica subsp. enterica serovar Rubislaw]|uniref:nucleotidyl transferase AbiEii/AbiGii toxin family protein n=1 Tax=Citrobacter portucalensis TaxID=1639133 RepID=UPI00237BCEA5|nr:nucleotidyl transferase AbiEii/AbiGii toxin family protein [Citrobacter portucalensis]EEA8304788.1 nucleotidyl transferase AbiEii/AbiGii toxin family protein [Salmonella enterica subsp. enterica serovar Rubislaw]MDQ9159123.1 nucleotidyl transferase AbiEii/AbiGii toxin family protein [Citrobacter portucalensis]
MEHSIEDWIAAAPRDRVTFRQAVHIVLQAIASSDYLQPRMIMKGGMLMGLRYQSSRFTEDIDFSTSLRYADIDETLFREELSESLQIASDELPYQVLCAVQRIEIQPKDVENATFPSFKLKIGYARRNNEGEMTRLRNGQSPNTVKIDYSFNEHSFEMDHISLTNEEELQAYSFTDLVAEKIRSVIQQVERNRSRRQDIYDLNLLMDIVTPDEKECHTILTTLLDKSAERLPAGTVNPDTLSHPEIRERSSREYARLRDEIEGELPDFDHAYNRLEKFYRSLPWLQVSGWQNAQV